MFHYHDADADPVLSEKLERLESGLRELGLYVDTTTTVMDDEGIQTVVVDCLVGDLAFSKRVQDPEQAQMDTSFRRIVAGQQGERVNDVREDLRRRLGGER